MATEEAGGRWPGSGARRGSGRRIVRVVLLALLLAFVIGLVIGTAIRRRLDEPVRYIGALEARPIHALAPTSALQRGPR